MVAASSTPRLAPCEDVGKKWVHGVACHDDETGVGVAFVDIWPENELPVIDIFHLLPDADVRRIPVFDILAHVLALAGKTPAFLDIAKISMGSDRINLPSAAQGGDKTMQVCAYLKRCIWSFK